MGKNLIIKGADFSANAIPKEDIEITSLLTLVKGVNGINLSEDAERAGLLPRFDISPYAEEGYTKIKVVTKVNGIISFLTNSEDASASGNIYQIAPTPPDTGYAPAGEYIATIENVIGYYFGVNIDLTTAGDLSNLSDYMSVILVDE